jgi:hypothetical protein
MSALTPVQAKNVPFAMGTDGIIYKNVVCKKLSGITLTPTIAEEETDCGPATGVGAVKATFNVEIVLNTTPNGATEISANEVFIWANAGTLVYMLMSASGYIRRASGYISNLQESLPQGGFVTSTFTVTVNGLVTTV